MKLSILITLLTFFALSTGCTSTEKTSANSQTTAENTRPSDGISDDRNTHRDLADFLRKVPGVNVTGSGLNVNVVVRGSASFIGGNEPLYVIDGQAVGTSYSEANRMLNVNDIDYVRVLKDADAAYYGVRGGNGVIQVFTKKQGRP